MRPTVRIRGADRLARKLERIRRDLEPAAITEAGGDELADEWRGRVPVDEGHYRDAISVAASDDGTAVYVDDVPGLADDEQPRHYAPRLEFGSGSMPAKPSLRPAVDASRRRVGAAMRAETRRQLP